MTEDEVSAEMYISAHRSAEIEVLTWQGIGGKSYFYHDLRLLLPGAGVQKPDLVLLLDEVVWVIEIKGLHRDSFREDEPKLSFLFASLSTADIIRQISRSSRKSFSAQTLVRVAVAYGEGDRETDCAEGVVHLPWHTWRPNIVTMLRSMSVE